MAKFKQKSIDAIQFTGENTAEVLAFMTGKAEGVAGQKLTESGPDVRLRFPKGELTIQPGDWVMSGAKGEFYSCDNEAFLGAYEPDVK